jgi:carbon storage regulator
MLILTRKLGQKINIGEDIVITLVEIRGTQVKLGIEAPGSTNIYRREIYEKIKGQNVSSSRIGPADVSTAISLLETNQSRGKKN